MREGKEKDFLSEGMSVLAEGLNDVTDQHLPHEAVEREEDDGLPHRPHV